MTNILSKCTPQWVKGSPSRNNIKRRLIGFSNPIVGRRNDEELMLMDPRVQRSEEEPEAPVPLSGMIVFTKSQNDDEDEDEEDESEEELYTSNEYNKSQLDAIIALRDVVVKQRQTILKLRDRESVQRTQLSKLKKAAVDEATVKERKQQRDARQQRDAPSAEEQRLGIPRREVDPSATLTALSLSRDNGISRQPSASRSAFSSPQTSTRGADPAQTTTSDEDGTEIVFEDDDSDDSDDEEGERKVSFATPSSERSESTFPDPLELVYGSDMEDQQRDPSETGGSSTGFKEDDYDSMLYEGYKKKRTNSANLEESIRSIQEEATRTNAAMVNYQLNSTRDELKALKAAMRQKDESIKKLQAKLEAKDQEMSNLALTKDLLEGEVMKVREDLAECVNYIAQMKVDRLQQEARAAQLEEERILFEEEKGDGDLQSFHTPPPIESVDFDAVSPIPNSIMSQSSNREAVTPKRRIRFGYSSASMRTPNTARTSNTSPSSGRYSDRGAGDKNMVKEVANEEAEEEEERGTCLDKPPCLPIPRKSRAKVMEKSAPPFHKFDEQMSRSPFGSMRKRFAGKKKGNNRRSGRKQTSVSTLVSIDETELNALRHARQESEDFKKKLETSTSEYDEQVRQLQTQVAALRQKNLHFESRLEHEANMAEETKNLEVRSLRRELNEKDKSISKLRRVNSVLRQQRTVSVGNF